MLAIKIIALAGISKIPGHTGNIIDGHIYGSDKYRIMFAVFSLICNKFSLGRFQHMYLRGKGIVAAGIIHI